jgi:fibronectin-binding autotransporter adhesin
VAPGATLTLTSILSGTGGFQRGGDQGTLVLTAANVFSGSVNLAGGVTRITHSSALGSSASGTNVIWGASLQLDGSAGGLTLAEPITVNGSGVNGGGNLENVAGNNLLTGPVTLITGQSVIGSSAGTLTFGAGISVSGSLGLTLTGAGDFVIAGSGLGAVSGVTKLGTGRASLTAAAPGFITALTVTGGTFALSGNGSLGSAAATVAVNPGATLRLDNSGGVVNNRLGGSSRGLTLTNGAFEYLSNAAAPSSESLGTLSHNWGLNTIRVTTTGQPSTLNFLNVNSTSTGATMQLETLGTRAAFGTPSNTILFGTPPGQANGLLPRWIVNDANGVNFATYVSAGSVGLTAFSAYNTTNSPYSPLATETPLYTADVSFATRTLNAFAARGASLTLGATSGSQTLTLSSGGLLIDGGTTTIAPNLLVGAGAAEFGLNVATGATLRVQGALTGSGWANKGLGGTLIFEAPQYMTGGFFSLNGGTVKLAGGLNTLQPVQGIALSAGSTLDLAGNSQSFGNLSSPFAIRDRGRGRPDH